MFGLLASTAQAQEEPAVNYESISDQELLRMFGSEPFCVTGPHGERLLVNPRGMSPKKLRRLLQKDAQNRQAVYGQTKNEGQGSSKRKEKVQKEEPKKEIPEPAENKCKEKECSAGWGWPHEHGKPVGYWEWRKDESVPSERKLEFVTYPGETWFKEKRASAPKGLVSYYKEVKIHPLYPLPPWAGPSKPIGYWYEFAVPDGSGGWKKKKRVVLDSGVTWVEDVFEFLGKDLIL
jgi:hypothetical protein